MRKRYLQIFVPLAIVAMVVGIWVLKQQQTEFGVSFSSTDRASLPFHLQDADFSLESEGAVDVEELASYHLPMIIDYGFDSCSPCKRMAPDLETINEECFGKAFIKYVDVSEFPTADDDVPVLVFPTQLFYNADGTPFNPSDKLKERIKFAIYYNSDTGTVTYCAHQGTLTADEMRLILKEMGVR